MKISSIFSFIISNILLQSIFSNELDISTFSNFDEISATNLNLDIIIDFNKKT